MLPIDSTLLLLSCFLLRSAWPLLVPCAALLLASWLACCVLRGALTALPAAKRGPRAPAETAAASGRFARCSRRCCATRAVATAHLACESCGRCGREIFCSAIR